MRGYECDKMGYTNNKVKNFIFLYFLLGNCVDVSECECRCVECLFYDIYIYIIILD